MTTVMKILTTLPVTMPLGDAIEEAKKIKKDGELAKGRVRVEAYRQTHMDQKRASDRKYKARKKEKLQAASDEKNHMTPN